MTSFQETYIIIKEIRPHLGVAAGGLSGELSSQLSFGKCPVWATAAGGAIPIPPMCKPQLKAQGRTGAQGRVKVATQA